MALRARRFVWLGALGHTGYAVAVTSAYPLVTLILSLLFLGEAITLQKTIGVVLVVAGVIILSI